MIFFTLSLLAGMVLGQRFKVLILIPAIAVALFGAICAGILLGQNPWSIALMSIGVTTGLQIGYLMGTAIRFFLVASRTLRLRSSSAGRGLVH
jgi:uncharacterized membrane protein